MALTLIDNTPGKKSERDSLDIISGCDDCILIRAGETFDGVAQRANILALVVNDTAVIGNLIARDAAATDVVGGGLVLGYKNIDSQTLSVGAYIQAGKYKEGGIGWSSVTVTSGSVWAYYKYIPNNVGY